MIDDTPNPQSVIVDWCNQISRSITRRDIKQHMMQVSEKVRVYGVPGHDYLTFLDWEKRRSHEFKHNMIQTLTYQLNRIKSSTPVRILFEAEETMQANTGQVIILNKEITLELNSRLQHWQVVEENITHWEIQD